MLDIRNEDPYELGKSLLRAFRRVSKRLGTRYHSSSPPHGIPLNWIYEGKVATLAPHIRAKLRELLREPVKR
jgi:hypothetical protein